MLSDEKTHFYLLLKFVFFYMYLKTYKDMFSYIFRAIRYFLLLITLNCLTNSALIANLEIHVVHVEEQQSVSNTKQFSNR